MLQVGATGKGEWRYSSMHSQPGQLLEGSALFHTHHQTDSYIQGKEPQVPTAEEAWWIPEPVWTLWSTEESVRIETIFSGRLTHSLLVMLTE
jgi:hypothetical protein